MSRAYYLGSVPAGAVVERDEDGSILSFNPDGTAMRIKPVIGKDGNLTSVITTFPPIRLTIAPK